MHRPAMRASCTSVPVIRPCSSTERCSFQWFSVSVMATRARRRSARSLQSAGWAENRFGMPHDCEKFADARPESPPGNRPSASSVIRRYSAPSCHGESARWAHFRCRALKKPPCSSSRMIVISSWSSTDSFCSPGSVFSRKALMTATPARLGYGISGMYRG